MVDWKVEASRRKSQRFTRLARSLGRVTPGFENQRPGRSPLTVRAALGKIERNAII
jgi:hypothetical protein